jgi:protein-S-isoprenylcysteine O-methyltransferase Ste14
MFGWPLVSAGLLLACLISFSWGMRRFFSQPAGENSGMRLIRVCGSAFALLHLAAIIATPGVSAAQVLTGACLYLASLATFWWAIRTHGARPLSAAFSPDEPAHLVEAGPYRFLRHPFYCSYTLAWTAGIAATGRWWLIPTVVVMLAIYVRAARMEEEKFARSPLAAAYERYRSQTGMLLPNPAKLFRAR